MTMLSMGGGGKADKSISSDAGALTVELMFRRCLLINPHTHTQKDHAKRPNALAWETCPALVHVMHVSPMPGP